MPVQVTGSGPVRVPIEWVRPVMPPVDEALPCQLPNNLSGLLPQSNTLTATLRLPPGLGALQSSTFTLGLLTQQQGTTPITITADLYDWQAGDWLPLTRSPAAVNPFYTLDDAATYLRGGDVRLRLRGNLGSYGCIAPIGQIEGTLP
ncbi:MAG: hypothetical protein HC893_13620 [Chloroflexaceae bacterium]|nr:hypothetical protein [Chloroflexaceae bacterium]